MTNDFENLTPFFVHSLDLASMKAVSRAFGLQYISFLTVRVTSPQIASLIRLVFLQAL